jgi:pilus assembly protein CpaC
MRNRLLLGLIGSSICLSFAAAGAGMTGASAAPGEARVLHVGNADEIPANDAGIVLEVGKGTLIRLARPAATVFVADPNIADVQVKSPSLVYVSAKAPGETVIYAVDAGDRVLLNAPIRVELDLSQLRRGLAQELPGERIALASVGNSLVLSGAVASAGQAQKARALAAAVVAGVKGGQVINRLSVATPNEVSLHVRIAEVDLSVLNAIGVNWHKFGQNLTINTNNPVTIPNVIGNNTLIVGSFPSQALSATIDALAQEGLVTDLAEPNLTAMSGQTASFLAGGEFPVPVAGASAATGGFPTITVEFKSFGVSLAFTPTVIDATHLNLRVRPEVSELSNNGAVSVPITNQQVITIPALTVRRADTTVELGSGESFALAGLLRHTSEQDISRVPWLGDIPILGALFRSDRFQRNESELVVIVTPYLVQPSTMRLAAPTDGLLLPHDAERVLLGDKYRQQLPAPARGPLGAGGRGLIGPAGFRLD